MVDENVLEYFQRWCTTAVSLKQQQPVLTKTKRSAVIVFRDPWTSNPPANVSDAVIPVYLAWIFVLFRVVSPSLGMSVLLRCVSLAKDADVVTSRKKTKPKRIRVDGRCVSRVLVQVESAHVADGVLLQKAS